MDSFCSEHVLNRILTRSFTSTAGLYTKSEPKVEERKLPTKEKVDATAQSSSLVSPPSAPTEVNDTVLFSCVDEDGEDERVELLAEVLEVGAELDLLDLSSSLSRASVSSEERSSQRSDPEHGILDESSEDSLINFCGTFLTLANDCRSPESVLQLLLNNINSLNCLYIAFKRSHIHERLPSHTIKLAALIVVQAPVYVGFALSTLSDAFDRALVPTTDEWSRIHGPSLANLSEGILTIFNVGSYEELCEKNVYASTRPEDITAHVWLIKINEVREMLVALLSALDLSILRLGLQKAFKRHCSLSYTSFLCDDARNRVEVMKTLVLEHSSICKGSLTLRVAPSNPSSPSRLVLATLRDIGDGERIWMEDAPTTSHPCLRVPLPGNALQSWDVREDTLRKHVAKCGMPELLLVPEVMTWPKERFSILCNWQHASHNASHSGSISSQGSVPKEHGLPLHNCHSVPTFPIAKFMNAWTQLGYHRLCSFERFLEVITFIKINALPYELEDGESKTKLSCESHLTLEELCLPLLWSLVEATARPSKANSVARLRLVDGKLKVQLVATRTIKSGESIVICPNLVSNAGWCQNCGDPRPHRRCDYSLH